jgi:RNA polymerase sigma-70 factor (ECF subfamily)
MNKNDFNLVWKNYRKKIYYLISQVLPAERENYDDLFQEVMMKIYNNIDNYKSKYSMDTWVYSIARNHCIDYLKTKKDHLSLSEHIEYDLKENPENLTLKSEFEINVKNALKDLADDERQIAFFIFYENMPYKKISKIMDLNVNTVKTRVRQIKRKLRNLLGEIL